MIEGIVQWWRGVRKIDFFVLKDGTEYEAITEIRNGPFGLLHAGSLSKEGKWADFGSDVVELIERCSDSGDYRVPIIRIKFGDKSA